MIDITGERFGRLLVAGYAGTRRSEKSGHTTTIWNCKCDCGKELVLPKHRLTSGNASSCGCYKSELITRENTTHGMSNTKLYRVWNSMKDRCYRKSCKGYVNYGGRGISICEEWLNDFQIFYDWAMDNGYSEGLTIERKNNDGNYEPSNCIWIPKSEQSKNRRNCHYITYHGETKTLSEWCRELHIDRECVRNKEKLLENGAEAIDTVLNSSRHK